jgi:hypothetical protein
MGGDYMKLDSVELYHKLIENNIYYLYHANSLTTSLGFIHNAGLLSRGAMEKRNVQQTGQNSDGIDKKFNVWNDIFLDTVDLHGYRYSGYSRQNIYGPVLFILKVNLLLDSRFNNVWITTNNPSNWNESDIEEDRYFDTVDNYIRDMGINRQQKMITIRNMNDSIPFSEYLECIKLDNPQRCFAKPQSNVYQYAYNKLNNAVNKAALNVNVIEHKCNNCYCIENYKDMNRMELDKYFQDYSN